jgi:NAD(P)-dependent dehydrogenase (short-subunit alcohol dehydrogenase family)
MIASLALQVTIPQQIVSTIYKVHNMAASRILFISGANTGLGFETVKALCDSQVSYRIILGSRSLEKGNAAIAEAQKLYPKSRSTLTAVQVDVESDESISNAFESISTNYGHLDVLVNNAGKYPIRLNRKLFGMWVDNSSIGGQFDQLLNDGRMSMREIWNKSWDVNVTGTHILTHTFMPLLLKSSDPRLIFITSGTSPLAESGETSLFVNKSPEKGWPKKSLLGVPAYRSSKTGLNMMRREWTRLLREDGVKTWCVSPGYLATGLGVGSAGNKQAGAIDPSIGAGFVRLVVEGGRDDDIGKAIRKDDVQPW